MRTMFIVIYTIYTRRVATTLWRGSIRLATSWIWTAVSESRRFFTARKPESKKNTPPKQRAGRLEGVIYNQDQGQQHALDISLAKSYCHH